MPRLRPHPRCRDFFRIHPNPMILEFMTVNAKNTRLVSQDANKTLKSLRRRSFYKAIDIVSEIENITERNSILQILYFPHQMSHINSFSFFATIFCSTKQNFTANVAGLS